MASPEFRAIIEPVQSAPIAPVAVVPRDSRPLIRLARVLRRRGFSAELLRRSPDDPMLGLLVRLFVRGSAVRRAEAERALRPVLTSDLAAAGLVRLDRELVRPLCHLAPWGGLLVAADLDTNRADQVTGPNRAAETLARLTIRRSADRALDLGTGSGVQALLAARHARQVVATDVSSRALAFASFNAGLNGFSNVDCRRGSWLDPVAGETFDLVVCNPPYVISPDSDFIYRDGGLPRDEVCRKLVTEIPRHLRDGGFATILVNWIHDDAWAPPLRAWIEGSGCDALLIRYATTEPKEYAERWNRDRGFENRHRFEKTVARWTDYYRRAGVRAIGSGVVVLRRRTSGRNWIRPIEAAEAPTGPSSEQLLRLFAAGDFLESLPGEAAMLDRVFALVDGHRVKQTLRYEKARYVAEPATVSITPGMGVEAKVDSRALEILFACDGCRPLRDGVREIARRRGEPEASVTGLATTAMRRLVELGFAVPLDGRGPQPPNS